MINCTENIYLAGAIEKAKDLGKGWREDYTPVLENLGFTVLDPVFLEKQKLKGKHVNRLPKGIGHWHELKNSDDPKHLDRFNRYMDAIIKADLDIVVDDASIIVVLWDEDAARGAGTHGEMTVAKYFKKPVYVVATYQLPAWLLGCSTKVFDNFDDLTLALEKDFKCTY